MDSRLALTDVTVRRGPNTIVEGLRLEITPGSPFWIVGPNGAGKTSLLRVVAGLDRPAAGEIVQDAPSDAPYRYFHSEMGLPNWSAVGAWERLVASLAPDRAPPTALRPELSRDRWVRRLSTGERKRLLLDVLFRVPGSLLLDEPYEHLSPDAKTVLTELIRGRARSDLVVVVTNQATHMAQDERGIHIEGGRAEPLGGAA